MAITTQTNTPGQFRAGDTVKWEISFTDYPATSWALTYYFKKAGHENIEIVAGESGDSYAVTIQGHASAEFAPGKWDWFARAEGTTGSIVAAEGCLNVLPDPASNNSGSHAESMLRQIQAVQAERAGKPYNQTDIAGSSFIYKTDAELRAEERHWLARVKSERRRQQANENGRPSRIGRIMLR